MENDKGGRFGEKMVTILKLPAKLSLQFLPNPNQDFYIHAYATDCSFFSSSDICLIFVCIFVCSHYYYCVYAIAEQGSASSLCLDYVKTFELSTLINAPLSFTLQ